MLQTEIHTYARQLMETFGPNAIAKAAERAVECEAQEKMTRRKPGGALKTL